MVVPEIPLVSALSFLQPYIFSPLVALSFGGTLLLYLRGLRALRAQGGCAGVLRPLAFFVGLGLSYTMLHTGFDYYAQYLFFAHRLQHLVLHHLGPFFIALAAPWALLRLGLPERLREHAAWLWNNPVSQGSYGFLQHPVVAPVLFVGLIYFWLIPSIHFDAMLSLTLYQVMNWSMFLDGLLFWWLILDPRDPERAGTVRFLPRVLILFLIMIPQILLGAYITLANVDLYDVYAVCGRAWPIAPETDQQLGGLITWIPAAMMSALGMVVVLSNMFRNEARREAEGSAVPSPIP